MVGPKKGQNQGAQFPIADSYIEAEAANLMRWKASELFDACQPCGAEANMAKYLAAKASAADACSLYEAGLTIDSLSEPLYQALMRARLSLGQSAEAI